MSCWMWPSQALWLRGLIFLSPLQDQLTRAGANMGKGGFSVLDLHARDGRLELTVD